jgi:lipooligosaccharide transport system ATP-binding protein
VTSPETGTSVVVRATGLTKRYGDLTAVDGIDLEINSGEVFGILGPNGAGKSTTLRMLGCVSAPTAGVLRVFGLDPVADGVAIRQRLGVCHQENSLDPELSVQDNLITYARYFGISRPRARQQAAELLEFVNLADRGPHKVEHLSGGMRRRLAIARALISVPTMVILDEPTTGLDPQARHLIWERLHELRRRGVTLVLTTHYMDEAEYLCDRLVVLDSGRIVAAGDPAALIKEHATKEVVELRPSRDHSPAALAEALPAARGRTEVLSDRVLIYADDGEAVLAGLHDRRLDAVSTSVRRTSLEDVFLLLTGRTLVD